MDLPSGDQAGERSWTPGVSVRLRGSPFSAGTVTISPRNSKTARAPLGETAAFRIHCEPLTKRSRSSARSVATPIDEPAAWPSGRRHRGGARRPARRRSGPAPAEAERTGKSLKLGQLLDLLGGRVEGEQVELAVRGPSGRRSCPPTTSGRRRSTGPRAGAASRCRSPGRRRSRCARSGRPGSSSTG